MDNQQLNKIAQLEKELKITISFSIIKILG